MPTAGSADSLTVYSGQPERGECGADLLRGKMAHDRGSGSRSPKMLPLMLEAVADAHLHRARERRIRIAHETGIPQSEDDARCQTY